MLVLNKEVFFYNRDILNKFCEDVMGRSYDDESRMFNRIFAQHMIDAYEADIKLTEQIQEKISPDIIPIVSFEFCNTCDLNKFDFYAVSTKEDSHVLKSQELLFYEYCDRYFGHINGLLIKLNRASRGE